MKKRLNPMALAIAGATMGHLARESEATDLELQHALRTTRAELDAFGFEAGAVVNASQSEVIKQTLYDFQLYATAGTAQMSFFQQPVGQGVTSAPGGVVGTAKSVADTNMQLAGQLPSGVAYKIESIEVSFLPGSVSTANTYTMAALSLFNAAAAATVAGPVNDVNTFYQSGTLELNVLQKNYLRESPLMRFPPKATLDLSAAVSSNSATVGEVAVVLAKAGGRPYYMDVCPITIKPAIAFDVTLKWPGVVATPSGFNGRVGIILDGLMMRASQ